MSDTEADEIAAYVKASRRATPEDSRFRSLEVERLRREIEAKRPSSR